MAGALLMAAVAIGSVIASPANAGRVNAGPEWGEDAAINAMRMGGMIMLSWPAATDDGGVVDYEIWVGQQLRQRVPGDVTMAMIATNSPMSVLSVVAVDGAGNTSGRLTTAGTVMAESGTPTIRIRVIETIGVGDAATSGIDGEVRPVESIPGDGSTTVPPSTVPSTTVPSTTVPSTTVPSTTVPSTTMPATTLPSTTVPSTTVPSTTVPTTTTSAPDTVVEAACPSDTIRIVGPELNIVNRESEPIAFAIPAGRYRVVMHSADEGHRAGHQTDQRSERWSVVTDNGWETPISPDLAEDALEAAFDMGTMDLDASSTVRFVWHGVAPSYDSVVPTLELQCVALEPSTEVVPLVEVDAADAEIVGGGSSLTIERGPTADSFTVTQSARARVTDLVLCERRDDPLRASLFGATTMAVSCSTGAVDLVDGAAVVMTSDGLRVDLAGGASVLISERAITSQSDAGVVVRAGSDSTHLASGQRVMRARLTDAVAADR